MKKTTILAAAFIAVMGTSAHAEIRNDVLPGDRIKENWDASNQYDSFGHYMSGTPMAKTSNPSGNGEPYNTPTSKGEMTPDQRAAHRQAMHKKWQSMTPEQKEAAKAKHQAKMDSMTPEQKAAHKAEMKKKWDAMTPAEKAQWKANHPNAAMHHHMNHMTNGMTNGMSNSMTNSMSHMTHSNSPATTPATGY